MRRSPEPAWDRDHADRVWQDAVINAAIDKRRDEGRRAQGKKEARSNP